ncbi:MAG: type II toxin-antitoxin system RelE/ParE family toxin [Chloroflexota bacterium]
MPDAYRIEVSVAADRELAKLKDKILRQDFERLRTSIRSLAETPRPCGARKIKGAEHSYRIRAGSYRVVYDVYDRDRLVIILQVSRRTESTYRSV